MMIDHFADAGYAAGGKRFNRPSGDSIDSDVAGSEIMGQVPDGGLKGGLGDAHDVIVRHDPFSPEIGQGHDGTALGHQGDGRSGDGNEGIPAHVERSGKSDGDTRDTGDAAASGSLRGRHRGRRPA